MPSPTVASLIRATRPVCSLLMLGVGCGPAWAAADLALKLETRLGHNSNLFRQPDSGQTGALSTSVAEVGLDAGVAMPVASENTRLVLTTQLGLNRFGSASDMNHVRARATAEVQWRYSDVYSGMVQVGYQRRPYEFDSVYPKLDMVGRQWIASEASVHLTPDWSIPVTVGHLRSRQSDRIEHPDLDYRQTVLAVATRYRSPTGNVAEVGWNHSDRKYPNRTALDPAGLFNERTDNDLYGSVSWTSDPFTQWGARLASRGTSGGGVNRRLPIYSVWMAYTPSPMWQFTASASKLPVDINEADVVSSDQRGYRVSVTWSPSPKVALTVSADQNRQTDILNPNLTPRVPLNPQTRSTGLRVQYEIDKGWNVFAQWNKEQREQALLGTSKQTLWHLGLNHQFENAAGSAGRIRPTLVSFD